MNISYVGKRAELSPDQQRKMDARWQKIAKLIEWKGQREAHVAITNERHLTNVEIKVNFYDHPLVGIGSDSDYFTAASQALDKLEKQALKVRTKWRDTHRSPKEKGESAEVVGDIVTAGSENGDEEPITRVFRVNHHSQRKPMTLDEAILEIDNRPYIVYRDADKECVSVLIRRADGNFDLIES